SALVQLHHAEVFRNGHRALGPLSWTWETGQHWLVTGENGSGKSTLLRLIAGEFHPALGGSVARPFLTRDVQSERRRHIGLVSAEVGIRQRLSLSGREWTGRDVLASAFAGTEGFAEDLTPEQTRAVDELAERLDLSALLPRPAEKLSQGQLRRLLLARAVVHRPTLLLLDEGLDFVDAAHRSQFLGLLPELVTGGTHLLVVAHREADALPGLTHHLHLAAGQAARLSAVNDSSDSAHLQTLP
ncbi:MAG: ATP-binding cassette domain-containing protein, partial [Deinococcus sp.]|uniref:ATP-binding cassette domain-containing protein n=1 Tax=Deinococcus sp. TaxID=47478 RepID=UPI0026DBB8BA